MSTHDDLRDIALTEFAYAGYAGTSLQRIAEIAGLSKASVLYHYSSKEALLAAAVGPALDRIESILDDVGSALATADARRAFIEQFVDLLLEHRLAVHVFINQGQSLEDVPVIDRANELVVRLSDFFNSAVASVEDHLRFGIALGGAAYVLSVKQDDPMADPTPEMVAQVRAGLISILTSLLDPVSVTPTSNVAGA